MDPKNRRTAGRSELHVVAILDDQITSLLLVSMHAFNIVTIVIPSVKMQAIESWLESPSASALAPRDHLTCTEYSLHPDSSRRNLNRWLPGVRAVVSSLTSSASM